MKGIARLALLIGPGLGYWFFARPQMLKWGTRLGESQRRMSGDDVVPAPNFQATHAVDIAAPPEAVWPWLAQMGREFTGWYGIDALTNRGVPSATYLRQDLPSPQIGMMTDWRLGILVLEPQCLLTLGGFDIPIAGAARGDLSLSYRLEPRGENTRLLVRTRLFTYGPLATLLNVLVFEPLQWADSVRQLQGIKTRAEATGRAIEIALAGSAT